MKEDFKNNLIESTIEELMKQPDYDSFQNEAEEIERAICFACSIVIARKGWEKERLDKEVTA